MATLGNHEALFETPLGALYRGDCLELMKEIPESSVDMVICDPPYGTTACEWDKKLPMKEFWERTLRVARERAAVAITAQQPFATDVIVAARKVFRYELIWEKDVAVGFLNANRMPLRAHENVLLFYRKLPTYVPQWEEGRPYRRGKKHRNVGIYGKPGDGEAVDNPGRRYPRSVLRFPRGLATGHPTEKPIGLFRWLVLTYTRPGETVLDPCMGSGTTAVACEETGRRWIGIERDAGFCEMAAERIGRAASADPLTGSPRRA
jgi:site-specific DNA-methyltransferase (adenine-specific)